MITRSKRPNFLTATRLLTLAATLVKQSIDRRTGEHIDINDALIQARNIEKFPLSAFQRAHRALDLLFRDPKTGRRKEFGKRFSESGNPHAINSVKNNAKLRIDALHKAANRAMTPLPSHVTRCETAPTVKLGKVRGAPKVSI